MNEELKAKLTELLDILSNKKDEGSINQTEDGMYDIVTLIIDKDIDTLIEILSDYK